ncbi:MAG: tetratricopeptide repeat protein [Crocinitomicaceae bacterium]|nr:tetratricopeptide repeat protein [Crocinitomicaceae bacterium]
MKKTWLLGVLAITSVAFGQKKNETTAAIEMKSKFPSALRSNDFETAKKSILTAKEFIDLAAAHEDTKNSSKTLFYKGEVYFNIVNLAYKANDAELKAMDETTMLQTAVDAFKKGFDEDNKYDSDIKDAVDRARFFFDQNANKNFQESNFARAGELYNWQAEFYATVGGLDTGALYYSGVCYEKAEMYDKAAANYLKAAKAGYKGALSYSLASAALRKAGKSKEAEAIVNDARKQYPTDRDLLLELVNIHIDNNDAAAAEEALNAAIATDPNNKQLHYSIGTIYIELGQNDKAEAALRKALEIDPNYVDAQYQLGAHLVSWAGDLKTEASQLKFGDARYDVLMNQSTETYRKAIIPLEQYIEKNPKDKAVLNILFQLYRSLGDSAKALEYKKRMDEL